MTRLTLVILILFETLKECDPGFEITKKCGTGNHGNLLLGLGMTMKCDTFDHGNPYSV